MIVEDASPAQVLHAADLWLTLRLTGWRTLRSPPKPLK
jgi:hypothetical protein